MVDRDGITESSRGTPELSSVSARNGNSDLRAPSRRALAVAIGTSGGESMRLTVKSAAAVAALAVGMPSLASAQQQAQGSSESQTALTAMAGNAANWVMPNGDYANTRYS